MRSVEKVGLLFQDPCVQRLKLEPASKRRTRQCIGLLRRFRRYMHQRPAVGGRFCHQLHLAAALNRDLPPGGSINAVPDRQQTMVLQDHRFVIAECFGDSGAFVEIHGDPTELGIDGMIIVESADILRDWVKWAAECRP